MIKQYESADKLPHQWDCLAADNPYMKRDFLSFMETVNPCRQRYFAVENKQGNLRAAFMTFVQEGYNLAMFTRFSLFIRITMIYLPLSVTRPGIVYDELTREVLDFIKGIKGYKMMLNVGDENLSDFAKGLTCPKCVLHLRWDTFDDYFAGLRSNYRYRYKKTFEKSAPLQLRWLENGGEFTDEMYELYLQTYSRSKIRVEKLSKEFFMGQYFKIFALENNGGVNYHRMLLEIVRYGIRNGFQTIDFGQTADDSKLKLGCAYTFLWAYLHHHNPIVNRICRMFAPMLEYRPVTTAYRVFREEHIS